MAQTPKRRPLALDDETVRLAAGLNKSCVWFLRESGVATEEDKLVKAAKAVIWWRYNRADDAWDKLNEAIGQLESLVGRPETEKEIY